MDGIVFDQFCKGSVFKTFGTNTPGAAAPGGGGIVVQIDFEKTQFVFNMFGKHRPIHNLQNQHYVYKVPYDGIIENLVGRELWC